MKRILIIITLVFICNVCLKSNTTIYEPFAPIDYTLPSDVTWGRISNKTQPFYESDQPNASDWSVIGGGRVYFCPHCGTALHPEDHTELDKKQNGNAYIYTGRIHHCLLPLNGEYIFVILIMLLLFSKILFVNKVKMNNMKKF